MCPARRHGCQVSEVRLSPASLEGQPHGPIRPSSDWERQPKAQSPLSKHRPSSKKSRSPGGGAETKRFFAGGRCRNVFVFNNAWKDHDSQIMIRLA